MEVVLLASQEFTRNKLPRQQRHDPMLNMVYKSNYEVNLANQLCPQISLEDFHDARGGSLNNLRSTGPSWSFLDNNNKLGFKMNC